MMGQLPGGQQRLFYSFNLEDHVPAQHLLRSIDQCLDLSDLRAYLADFYSPIGRPSIDPEFTPLVNEPFVLACRRDHPLAKRSEVAWRELSDYRLIGVGRLSGNRVLLDHGLAHLDWRPSWFYEVQHLSTSLGMVEAGLGIAALPSLAMPAEDHPILVSRPLVDPVISRTLGLVRRRGSSLSPAAEQFVETLLRQWPSYTSIGTSSPAEPES